MWSRREFIATGSLALAGLPAMAAINKKEGPLVHHVFFWMANPASAADREKLLLGLRSLAKIDTIRSMRIGVPAATPARDVVDASYHFSLLLTFDDVHGHENYQSHPVHTQFVNNHKDLWARVVVYDSVNL